jgi:hypothetical protein
VSSPRRPDHEQVLSGADERADGDDNLVDDAVDLGRP